MTGPTPGHRARCRRRSRWRRSELLARALAPQRRCPRRARAPAAVCPVRTAPDRPVDLRRRRRRGQDRTDLRTRRERRSGAGVERLHTSDQIGPGSAVDDPVAHLREVVRGRRCERAARRAAAPFRRRSAVPRGVPAVPVLLRPDLRPSLLRVPPHALQLGPLRVPPHALPPDLPHAPRSGTPGAPCAARACRQGRCRPARRASFPRDAAPGWSPPTTPPRSTRCGSRPRSSPETRGCAQRSHSRHFPADGWSTPATGPRDASPHIATPARPPRSRGTPTPRTAAACRGARPSCAVRHRKVSRKAQEGEV